MFPARLLRVLVKTLPFKYKYMYLYSVYNNNNNNLKKKIERKESRVLTVYIKIIIKKKNAPSILGLIDY